MTRTTTVGSDVDSWCSRCKLMLAHTVEAVVGERITRVHCNTCKAQHTYRPAPPGVKGAKTTRSATPRTAKPRAPSGNDLETLLRGRDASKARPYAPGERFAAGELIRHATFGLGIITGLKDDNKIEVAFQDGPKVLVHRR
jgi:hypothetical protein